LDAEDLVVDDEDLAVEELGLLDGGAFGPEGGAPEAGGEVGDKGGGFAVAQALAAAHTGLVGHALAVEVPGLAVLGEASAQTLRPWQAIDKSWPGRSTAGRPARAATSGVAPEAVRSAGRAGPRRPVRRSA